MISTLHKVVLTNQDSSYDTFVRCLLKGGFLSDLKQLICKKACPRETLTNKFKKTELDFLLHEGEYEFQSNGNTFRLVAERGDAVLTTECRQIDYLKKISVYGPTIELIKELVQKVFNVLAVEDDSSMITIYENNGGYWQISKEKKPRKLESVIFKPEFVQEVLDDIRDFIDSESWYVEMGIPYKRSYLLYGPPGTGKSSFAQGIAAEIEYSICFVNCSDKINDFNFNTLLNKAPKKSIILIEDVDSIFSERKNVQKKNNLTFSGFLNAIDGVRSQEGRIIIMTTNFKDRLDPALLRPGRVDEKYEISLSSRFQMEKLCYRFYKNQKLAEEFASSLPEHKFSMSMIQGFLLKYRKNPEKIIGKIEDLLNSEENIKIGHYLSEINCQECINDFKIEECFTLASARNLPKAEIEKICEKLNPLLKGRLFETIQMDRKNYIKSPEAMEKFIQDSIPSEEMAREVRTYVKENNVNTFYLIRDKIRELEKSKEEPKEQEKAA